MVLSVKSYSGLWDRFVSFDNLVAAYENMRKNKKLRLESMKTHCDYMAVICAIRERLLDGTWSQKQYRTFTVSNETKIRHIEAPDFADRIVHHALVQILEPIYERRFIFDSYSCRKGKGFHSASDRLKYFMRKAQGMWGLKEAYVVQCDISKFFASIRHQVLFDILARSVRERQLLNICERAIIVPSNNTGVGIPIGALTSQLMANVYLDGLDHFVKENMLAKFYLRYADDFVIIASDKHTAHTMMDDVNWFVQTQLCLKLNPKSSVYPLHHGIDFCGYKTFVTHRLPRKRNVKRAEVSLRQAYMNRDKNKFRGVLASFYGYVRKCPNVAIFDKIKRRIVEKCGKLTELK